MGGIGTLFQAKLKVGAVDDPLEHEADRAADAVMSDGVASVRGAAAGSPVQRACAACSAGEGKCPKCDEEHQVQRKPLDAAASPSGADGHVGTALASGGQPLSSSMRAFMEPRFGRDFSTVRVHAGQAASHAAAALGARAFTIGRNIVFGASEYAPETAAGQRLVAHELAHVVQQSTGTHATVQRQEKKKGLGGLLDLQFDPCVSYEDHQVCGSDAAKLCSKVDLPGCGTVCKLFGCDKPDKPKTQCPPGWRAAGSKGFEGQCCPESSPADNEQSCCPPQRIAFLDMRCCKPDEAVVDNHCKKSSEIPPGPTSLCPPPGKPTLLGGKCCFPPEVPQGLSECGVPPPTPKPPQPRPAPRIPEAVEIFFHQDRPHPGEGAGALGSASTSRGKANFDALVKKLKADPTLVVQLVGRASPEGPKGSEETYNRDLGARRARTVAAALKAAGVPDSQLADPADSDLRAECVPIATGLVTCGMAGSTGDSDRQVLARVFTK
ncbi:MAG TPA: DUF4157 domain-containing protein [Kofleriaceae bacterium]